MSSSKSEAVSRGRSTTQSKARPGFPALKAVTSDHIDTSVIDEHEDHHPWDDDYLEGSTSRNALSRHDEAEEEHDQADGNSDQTLRNAEEEASPEGVVRRKGKADLSDAEKGQAQGEKQKPRRRTSTNASERWQDPETRAWKDDIVTFDTKSDPANPKNWSRNRKITVTMLFGMTTMASTFASSVFSPALSYVADEFHISREVSVLGVSLFVLGYVPGPIIFAPISELYGRKLSVLIPVFIFGCFSAGTATAKDIQTVFLTRFFAGMFASAPVSNVGGGLADMFDQRERGTAVVFYSLAVVAGPTLGPIIGGAVSQSYLGWRWVEYLVVILVSVIVVLDIFLLPETFAPVILTRKAQQLRWKTERWALHSRQEMKPFSLNSFLHKNLMLPLKMIVMEPMVTCICAYNSFAYGILYMLFAAVPIVYEQGRGWNTLVGSLPFLAVLLGSFTAAGINILYSTKVFGPHLDKHGGKAEPEMRLPPMMIGSILFPIGFFLLGWTSDPSIHWFPSVLGLYFIGTSFLLIFQAGINYLIDAYTAVSASAVAANTFARSVFAAALPLVAMPMFNNLGVNYACTLLGAVATVLGAVPFIFYKFGPKLRAMSRMAPQK